MENTDFIVEDAILKKYVGTDAMIVIPNEVTAIGSFAFDNCESLVSVEVPDSVQCIKEGAFWKCDNLENLVFRGSLPNIENGAILSCNKLAIAADVFHTEEKLPVGLIDCIRAGKANCNILAPEVAWLVLYQGSKKWKELVEDIIFLGGVDANAIGEEICKLLQEHITVKKKIKDVAIQFMVDNCLYNYLIIIVNRFLNLSEKEMNSYIEKYKGNEKVSLVFQMIKKQKFEDNVESIKESNNQKLADARKLFKLKNIDEGILIKDYIGTKNEVHIPDYIADKKVVGVEIRTFFGKDIIVTGSERTTSTFARNEIVSAAVGDRVSLGTYFSEKDAVNSKLEWTVLKREDDKLLLVTEYAIEVLPFYSGSVVKTKI